MTSIDHGRRPATIVYDLPPEDRYVPPQRRHGPPQLPEMLALAMALRADGHDVGDALAKVEAVSAAVDAVPGYDPARHFASDLLAMSPQDVAEGVRQCAVDLAIQQEIVRVVGDVQVLLVASATDALSQVADRVITAMRTPFDKAVKAVQAAADRGLTSSTDPAALAATADPDVIAAYRGLAAATAVLDELHVKRNQMTLLGRIGPPDHPLCCFVTGVSEDELEGAENIWRGDSELVSNVLTGGPAGGGTHLARRIRHRVGGPWLALLVSGYTLRLNTGAEAHAVYAAAVRGSHTHDDEAQDSDGANRTGDPDAA